MLIRRKKPKPEPPFEPPTNNPAIEFNFHDFITIRLTPTQIEHYKAIQWLIGGPRRTGRTFLLAVCFIEKALRNPGVHIIIFDHMPLMFRNQKYLELEIRGIILSFPEPIYKAFSFYSDPCALKFEL